MNHGATSSAQMRAFNTLAVLDHAWSNGPATVGEAMASTGLSRATVHAICDQLVEHGWLLDMADTRRNGLYQVGRPAHRFDVNVNATHVVAVEAAPTFVRGHVTDLRGHVLGSSRRRVHLKSSAHHRVCVVEACLTDAVEVAGLTRSSVARVVVGVPAPVDDAGVTRYKGNPFWDAVNPHLAARLRDLGWPAHVDNDVNLAATFEDEQGSGRGYANHLTLQMGPGIGAGVVIDGRLLRGGHGGVGEMHFLDHVDGVGGPEGLRHRVRKSAVAVLARDQRPSTLRQGDPRRLEPPRVWAAAATGDSVATEVMADASLWLATVVGSLASIFDPDRIVLSGPDAPSCLALLDDVTAKLPAYRHPPHPGVLVSAKSRDAVILGAAAQAIAHVRSHALDLTLPPRDIPGGVR